jgi:hypothetical protein
LNRAEFRRLAIVTLAGVCAVLVATLFVVLALGSRGDDPPGPKVGDHWHAPYAIFVNGVRLPAIPEVITGKGIHTHGDGIIHIHSYLTAEGSGASLAHFFSDMGGELTDTEMRVPGDLNVYRDGVIAGESTNGVIADGEEFRLRILRADSLIHPLSARFAAASGSCNDKPDSEFEQVGPNYVPQDGDCIRIVFGPSELPR